MKKILFVAAAIIAALTSCVKEADVVIPQEDAKVWVEFTAGVQTKAVLNETSLIWEADDKVSINGVEFSTEAEAITNDGKNAKFRAEVNSDFLTAESFTAVYPASAVTEEGNIVVPAEQDGSAKVVAVATVNDITETLNFMHVASFFKFQVPAEATEVSISADEDLTGTIKDVTFTTTDGVTTIDYAVVEETGKSTITVVGEFVPEETYYAAVLPGEKTNLNVKIGDKLSKAWDAPVDIKQGMIANMGVLPKVTLNKGVYEISDVDGLKWLSGQTDGKVTEVKIVEDIEFSEEFWVKQNLTIDLGTNTLTGTGSRFIRVASESDETVEVTIKNGEVLNNENGGRCIETRSGNVTLNLEGVTLSTPNNGANQPLTIGGSGDNITINIENSTITTNNVSGYAITTFNPVTMNIDNSEVSGWSVLYVKGADSSLGSAGSEFNITKSTLTGTNDVAQGESNSFSTIMIDTDDITVNVDGESTINTVANTNAHILLGLVNTTSNPDGVKNVNVTFDGTTINLEGEKAEYLSMIPGSDNEVKFPSKYADELVEELAEEGMTVSEPENDLVTIIRKPVKSDRNLAFAQESGTATYGDEFTLPELTGEGDLTKAVYEVTEGEAVTVTEGGVVTLVKAGTVTIKATVAEDDTHLAGEATYTLTVNKAARTLTFSSATATATVGKSFTPPTLTGTPDMSGVKYTSSNTDVATVDSETGEVEIVSPGETTITASAPDTDDYLAGSATYTLTVEIAEFQPEEGYIYMKPSDDWKSADARFAAYFFNQTWKDMTLVKGQLDIYQCEIPDGETNVIFCRMNPSTAENNFNDGVRWTQTSDLTMLKGCLYTISGWDNGEWSGEPAVVPVDASKLVVGFSGEFAGVGQWEEPAEGRKAEFKNVDYTDESIYAGTYTFELTDFVLTSNDKFKVRVDGDWLGNGTSISGISLASPDSDGNFVVYGAGTYDVTVKFSWDGGNYSNVNVVFAKQGVTEPEPEPDVNENELVIYLNTGGSSLWDQSDAWFDVWSWSNDGDGQWYTMISIGNGVYSVKVPKTKSKIIFVRRGPNMSQGWTNGTHLWNKTNDLTISSGNNCYTITGWGNNTEVCPGTWSVKQ